MRCGELKPGDQFTHSATGYDVTVIDVTPTGSVKFGQTGPSAIPILRVRVEGLPKPFAGVIEVAADQEVALLPRRPS